MRLYDSIEERGYKIEAYLPSGGEDELEWLLKVYKDAEVIREESIPMYHIPRYGVDAEDLFNLEEKTEELLSSVILYEIAGKEIADLTVKLFENNSSKALYWFEGMNLALGNKTPYEMCQEGKEEEVKNLIGRLEHGVFS